MDLVPRRKFGGLEGNLVQEAFHHGVQATRADVFAALVHELGDACNFLDRFVAEAELDALRGEERGVLLDRVDALAGVS